MGSIVINGNTYNDATSALGAAAPVAGTYYPTGEPPQWGEPPCIGVILSDRREIKFSAVDWTAEKDYGKARRLIYVDLLMVATLANLRTGVQALLDGLVTNTRYSVTINGLEFKGCKLDQKNCGRGRRVTVGAGFVGEVLPLVFKQLSDSN